MEVFRLVGSIVLKGAEAAEQQINQFSEKGASAGGKIGKAMLSAGKVVGKAFVAGTVAAAAGIAALTKKAVDSYAQYEQLEGGVKKLFGSASKDVMEYANNAYKTAGLSANEYMEQVTSFSAAMIKSLGGDTKKAAELSDMAMRDMSDNVNTFGTAAEDVQHAYQGFSKQNFTMLDNLKLGYGGTKEEMQKLLDDANKFNAEHGKMTDYQIDNYADIVQAIHTVQEQQHIAGTTANEAATTIEGSVGMMKGAWENFITGLGNDKADIGELFDQLWDSIGTVAENVLPRVQIILGRIGKVVREKLPEIINAIPGFLSSVLPPLITTAIDLVTQLAQAIIDNLPALFEMIINAIVTYFPLVLETIGNLMGQLMTAIFGEEQGGQIASQISELFSSITGIISSAISIIQTIWDACGQQIMTTLSVGISAIVGMVSGLFQVIDGIFKVFDGILNGDFSKIWEGIKQIFKGFFNFVSNFVNGQMNLLNGIISIACGLILSVFKNIFNSIKSVVTNVFNNIKSFVSSVWNSIKTTITNVINGIKGGIQNGLNGAKNTVSNILNAIKEKFRSIFEAAKNIVKSGIDKIKSFFNFKWELPKIKLPHFEVTGKFSLNPPSVPHFAPVKWYKKGMFDPVLMTSPTVFGMNPETGSLKAGGEAGEEIAGGSAKIMSMISQAANSGNDQLIVVLEKILQRLEHIEDNLYDKMVQALQTMGIDFDERELARLVKKYA